MKTIEHNVGKWPTVCHSVFWAERVTIQKSTGHSPYYLVHGTHPVLPFDVTEAMFMLPPMNPPVTTAELLASRAWQLRFREEDLDTIKGKIL